jgi:concanavalin A-like lectin/glucanase superfamily protein
VRQSRGVSPVGKFRVFISCALVLLLVSAQPVPPLSRRPQATTPHLVSDAPDTASAAFAAYRQGSRVEAMDQRTPVRSVFANPNGTRTAEISAVPTRVKQGSTWVPIDSTLVSRSDGSIAPRAVLGDVGLSAGGESAPLVRQVDGGREMSWYWPGVLPKPVLEGNRATYLEVSPGVDVQVTAVTGGFELVLVVKNAQAAAGLATIDLRVVTKGVHLSATETGGLSAVDGAGAVVFQSPPSVMWDAAGRDRSASVGMVVGKDTLSLVPDRKFLADPATVFPVVIDPRSETPDYSNWATTLSGKAGTSFWRQAGDGSSLAQVGKCWDKKQECKGIGVAWTYFEYNTSFVGDATILGAELRTTVQHSPECGGPDDHQLWQSAGGISPGTNWNNRPQGSRMLSQKPIPTVCNGWQGVSFAVDAQAIAPLGVSTYFLKAADENNQVAWRRYGSGDTKLSVTYNHPPDVPSDLQTDPPLPEPCRWCDGKSYVGDQSIRLIATLTDRDNDSVLPQWRVNTSGEVDAWNGSPQISGATHDTTVDLSPPDMDGKEIVWWVHASDGAVSSDLATGPGPFVVDQSDVTVQPGVSATLYKEDNVWHGGPGVADTFTFGAGGVGDIDHYLYGWSDPPSTSSSVDATSLGGPASVILSPPGDGPRTLYVQSVDRAGHRSPSRTYRFYVRAGNGAYAQWSFEGNTNDDAFLGDRNGTLNGNATYTAGARGTALLVDGAGSAMTAPNIVRTDTSFSVAAWVRADQTPGNRVMGAVSQDGNQASGWYLDYRDDNGVKRWSFRLASGDTANPGGFMANSAAVPQQGIWTHLTGVYDRIGKEIRLYVDGVLAARTAAPANFVPWNATGGLAVGREKSAGSPANSWLGAIDEVQVYDRALTDADVKATVSRDNVQVGHWTFDDQHGTTAVNSVAGGQDAVLMNGATFTDNGAVGRAVQFDGMDDQAATAGPAVRTDQSFTVAAWVRADRFAAVGTAMTAVSQDGSRNSGFYLQYNSTVQKWVFLKFTTDTDTPEWFGVTATQQPRLNEWVHLAGVFDAGTKQMSVYVNGEFGGAATLSGTAWDATGPLVIGRARFAGNPADFWPGAVDEVRMYSRALSADELLGIVRQNNVTTGSWKLDGTADDGSAQPHNGVLAGGAGWTAGQASTPNPKDLGVLLDGVDDYVHAPTVVDPSQSFSVAGWVRPDKPGSSSVVVSQSGTNTSTFLISAAGDGKWNLFVAAADKVDPPGDWVIGGTVQYGVWTHVVGVYSKERQRIELYINGELVGSTPHTATIATRGEFQIGRTLWNKAYVNYFSGVIDDVTTYSRALYADDVLALAGRDSTLVHNWNLDESSGTLAADSIGAESGRLTSGVEHAPGRVGNAVKLNGTNGMVTTPGVDLRTDQSFTVAAWVHLDGDCANPCKSDAVTIDSGPLSKLRLGRVVDNDHSEGSWFFEMPEPDGTVTRAAVTVDPAEAGSWVHLAGVYDAPAQKIWLYVNAERIDDGTLRTPWKALGGLRLGGGLLNGTPSEFWAGSVDDVRLYAGALNKDRILALYQSTPADAASPTMPVADAGYWTFDDNAGTTAADSSGRGRTATLRENATWLPGGRRGTSMRLNGTSGYAETSTAVVNTAQSFSVTAWANLSTVTGNHVVVSQDAAQVSAFQLRYQEAGSRWSVVVPAADQQGAATTVLTSTGPALPGLWAHLAVTYDAGLHQLRLYVNGVLSAVRVGVSFVGSAGPFAFGRAKGNADRFAGDIDEVRAFAKALSEGEVRRVHDENPSLVHGFWGFDGTPDDTSWRHQVTTLSGATSYVPGVHGQALQLDGVSGSAGTQIAGANPLDSITVSAWVKLSRTDRDATVFGQDGSRMSGFLLQYNKDVGRWIFGAAIQDADMSPMVYAYSPQAPVVGTWTHLTGVYDYAGRQLRLYVNGQLVGIRDNVAFWPAWGSFTIGRGRENGVPADFFSGALDDVQTDLGIATDADIRARAGNPAPFMSRPGR